MMDCFPGTYTTWIQREVKEANISKKNSFGNLSKDNTIREVHIQIIKQCGMFPIYLLTHAL